MDSEMILLQKYWAVANTYGKCLSEIKNPVHLELSILVVIRYICISNWWVCQAFHIPPKNLTAKRISVKLLLYHC